MYIHDMCVWDSASVRACVHVCVCVCGLLLNMKGRPDNPCTEAARGSRECSSRRKRVKYSVAFLEQIFGKTTYRASEMPYRFRHLVVVFFFTNIGIEAL